MENMRTFWDQNHPKIFSVQQDFLELYLMTGICEWVKLTVSDCYKEKPFFVQNEVSGSSHNLEFIVTSCLFKI